MPSYYPELTTEYFEIVPIAKGQEKVAHWITIKGVEKFQHKTRCSSIFGTIDWKQNKVRSATVNEGEIRIRLDLHSDVREGDLLKMRLLPTDSTNHQKIEAMRRAEDGIAVFIRFQQYDKEETLLDLGSVLERTLLSPTQDSALTQPTQFESLMSILSGKTDLAAENPMPKEDELNAMKSLMFAFKSFTDFYEKKKG